MMLSKFKGVGAFLDFHMSFMVNRFPMSALKTYNEKIKRQKDEEEKADLVKHDSRDICGTVRRWCA